MPFITKVSCTHNPPGRPDLLSSYGEGVELPEEGLDPQNPPYYARYEPSVADPPADPPPSKNGPKKTTAPPDPTKPDA